MIAVCAAKFVGYVCKKMGRQGVTWAGKVAIKICPDILEQLSSQVRKAIFATCGTNGKTTTNNMLCAALEAEGQKVICNHTGSNMLNGVVAAFVLASKWNGKIDADYACIEADEASTRHIFPRIKPDYMLLTNLFRDQLDRYGEIDITMNILEEMMRKIPKMQIIVNGDDALSAYLAMDSGNPYVTYGISKPVIKSAANEIREGRVTISMALNMLAFILNIILNATFIFGLFGAPKLGATGVAIATAVSRLIELAACVIVSFLSKDVKLNLTFMFIRSKVLFGDFIRLSLPALGNDVSWSVAFSMYSVILGHLGTDAVAANSLVTVVRNIGSVFCFAIASAGTILLGNVMGKGDLEKSKVYASRMLKMTIIAGAIGGVIVFAITPLVLRFASLSDGAMHYLKYMLLINTYYIMGSAVDTALIAGVFRAGGDTKFGLICDTIDMWVYAVPLGFFAAFVLKLPVLWVYFLLCTDEFVKWPWVFHHYRQGKWAQNITRENLFEQKAS